MTIGEHMTQSPLTLVVTIGDGRIESLRHVLETRECALKQALLRLGTVHYGRWVIIQTGGIYRAQLAFESNFDGEIDTHVEELAKELGGLIDEIYSHCDGFSPGANAAYLRKIRVREAAFYQGAPGRTVKTIAGEKALRSRIVRALESRAWSGQSARQIHTALQREVLSDPEFAWAKEQLQTPGTNWPALLLVVGIIVLLSPLLIAWAIYMQFFHELREPAGTITPNDVPDPLIAQNVRLEDFSFQNQFSQIMEMKPGRARLLTVKALYFLVRILDRIYFVHGKLMGIPTIHFARWVMLDNDQRMLFFSNFDGSWTQYLGDFIDKSGWGLNGIFGNTRTFPRIWFLLLKGAYDEMHFLGWSRSTQIPTQVWFAATVDQSIKNINDNTLIRNDLSRTLGEREAQEFLSRL
jgi:hypothetical protein